MKSTREAFPELPARSGNIEAAQTLCMPLTWLNLCNRLPQIVGEFHASQGRTNLRTALLLIGSFVNWYFYVLWNPHDTCSTVFPYGRSPPSWEHNPQQTPVNCPCCPNTNKLRTQAWTFSIPRWSRSTNWAATWSCTWAATKRYSWNSGLVPRSTHQDWISSKQPQIVEMCFHIAAHCGCWWLMVHWQAQFKSDQETKHQAFKDTWRHSSISTHLEP